MSDRVLGLMDASLLTVIGPKSSGADQRTEAPPATLDPLTEYMSLAMEARPKLARQGTPCALMNTLYYKAQVRCQPQLVGRVLQSMKERNQTDPLQTAMDKFACVQVVQTADDAEYLIIVRKRQGSTRLRICRHRRSPTPNGQCALDTDSDTPTYSRSPSTSIPYNTGKGPERHPLSARHSGGSSTWIGQPLCKISGGGGFRTQARVRYHPPPTGNGTRYLVDLHSVAFVDPKHLDREHISVLVRSLPNIRKSTGRDGMLTRREGFFDFMRSREETVYLASPALFSDAPLVDV